MPENVDVRIEEIVVEGLRWSEAVQFGRAVERELARLIQQSGLPKEQLSNRSIIEIDHDPGSMSSRQQRHPDAADVAAAIYRAVTR
jgi:hypothetical protein